MTVVVGFVFGWWDVSDRSEEPDGVEPIDPLQGGVLDEAVVIGVADAADAGFDAGFGKAFGVTDRQVLDPGSRVMHQVLWWVVEAFPDRLLQGIQCEVGAQ